MRAYPFVDGTTRYTLVDTPGFDDTFESDEVITNKILKWAEASYRSGTRLNGIVYLHNISVPKMRGSAYQNLQMFRQLCGDDALEHVILATTFWAEVEPQLGERREKELLEDNRFWARMVERGSKVMRLAQDRGSALHVLREVGGKTKMTLHAQQEMIDGVILRQTTAARTTHSLAQGVPISEPSNSKYAEAVRKRQDDARKRAKELKQVKRQVDRQRQEVEEMKRRVERERERRIRLYRTHQCRCQLIGGPFCANCGKRVGRSFYRK